ncbi:MAG TPA: argininosuccinate lyase [Vicinamibacteria bacterium]|nr:argininosuccinate lyase [Vicinamibacteria bacterium]
MGKDRKDAPARLWGGNYEGEPDREFWDFNRSLPFDRRLVAEEIAASRAYVAALARADALSPAEAATLDLGLAAVLESATAEALASAEEEDVHSWVEARLTEGIGDLAGQAHLGRSRNEQAVTALRLWARAAADRLRAATASLVGELARVGTAGAEAVMPGFTHTRAAEPITFGHFAAGHAWGLVRDFERLGDARRRANVLPLGSGALAGTALPLDREALARDLGFEAVSPSALDAVMDRDFAAEFAFACAQLQTHLSRLAEDLIWLSSPEFGFFALPEAYTTGSSLMPQKKNPDALELVRGKAARAQSAVLRLLALMKSLPAGYQKDLQEDKEAVFDVADTVAASLAVMRGVVAGLTLDREAMRKAAGQEETMAAGLAVALGRDGLPFRKAHERVAALVAEARSAGASLRETARARLAADHPRVAARLDEIFDPEQAVRTRAVPGGTAPEAVRESLRLAAQRVTGAP